MTTEGRRSPRIRIALLLAALALPALSSCTAIVGGAAFVAVVGAGVLTSRCYDYLDVIVYDDLGKKTCDATVTATSDGSSVELNSCYYAPLSDGNWKLRAALPGYADALTTVVVDHAHDCTRHVQSVELTMNRPGAVRKPTSLPPPLAMPPSGPPAPSSAAPSPEPPSADSPQTSAPNAASSSTPAPEPPTTSPPARDGVVAPAPFPAEAHSPKATPP